MKPEELRQFSEPLFNAICGLYPSDWLRITDKILAISTIRKDDYDGSKMYHVLFPESFDKDWYVVESENEAIVCDSEEDALLYWE